MPDISTAFVLSICNNTNCNTAFYFPLFFSGNNGRSTLPQSSTTTTDAIDAPHTGSIISNGAAAPQAARTAAIVEGISCIEAELSVISVSTVSGAPRRPVSVYRRSAACSPSGVAALDRPSRFAVTLALTASIACRSAAALPNSGRSSGMSRRDILPAMPDACSSSIIPLQKHISPAIETARLTACAAPVPTAAVTASIRPVIPPHSSASIKNITQTAESIDTAPFPAQDPLLGFSDKLHLTIKT